MSFKEKPVAELLFVCIKRVCGNSVYNAFCFVGDCFACGFGIFTIDECVLDILLNARHCRCCLKSNFINRVSLLISYIYAAQRAHIALFKIRNAKSLLENLRYIVFLRTLNSGSVGRGKRIFFADSRLCACCCGVELTHRKLHMVRLIGFACNKG